MRSISALIIASMLLSSTELRQLLRVPLLVHHYQEHSSRDAGMTLTGFLWMHYCTEQVHDHDFHQDERLPFRSHDNLPTLTVVIDELPVQDGLSLDPPVPPDPLFPEELAALLSGSRAPVWQPPKAG